MQIVKKGLKYVLFFLIAVLILVGILVLSAYIPRSAIKENVRDSAEYLCEKQVFFTQLDGIDSSRIDRYADSILLGIAYQYDDSHPLESVMESSYYYTDYQNENDNLMDAVTFDYEPNQEYMRYWHGSNAIVRPLLCILDIQQIYILNGIVLALLALWLLVLLLRARAFVPAAGIVAGLILTSVWFVPFSLEYTWTYMLMLIMSLAGWKAANRQRWKWLGILFLFSGILTNYLDFLTTESLTLLVPLLLVLWVGRSCKRTVAQMFRTAVSAFLAWGAGYVGMWLMKWIVASCVLRENIMPYVTGHIEERVGGGVGVGLWEFLSGAITRNIRCLFPLEYGTAGWIIGGILVLLCCYTGFVYRKKQLCVKWIQLYVVIGLVPYIRYIVLHNHSYLHSFFTYRAQMATVLAIALILGEITDWRYLGRAHAGKRKP